MQASLALVIVALQAITTIAHPSDHGSRCIGKDEADILVQNYLDFLSVEGGEDQARELGNDIISDGFTVQRSGSIASNMQQPDNKIINAGKEGYIEGRLDAAGSINAFDGHIKLIDTVVGCKSVVVYYEWLLDAGRDWETITILDVEKPRRRDDFQIWRVSVAHDSLAFAINQGAEVEWPETDDEGSK